MYDNICPLAVQKKSFKDIKECNTTINGIGHQGMRVMMQNYFENMRNMMYNYTYLTENFGKYSYFNI